MPPSIASTIIGRSTSQANYNTETGTGTVQKIYTDRSGNVVSADVLLDVSTQAMRNIPNQSGFKMAAGQSVTVNFVRGNKHNPQIIGGTGGGSAVIAAQQAAQPSANASTTPDPLGGPILMAIADANYTQSYVLGPGSNVIIQNIDGPTNTSGGFFPGIVNVSMAIMQVAAKPDPVDSGLLPGTIIEVITSYGENGGIYRLMGIDAFDPGNYWHEMATLDGPITAAGGLTSIKSQTGTGTTFVVEANPTITEPTILAMIGAKVYPSADSTTAIQILQADKTTSIVDIDTTNKRVGVNTASPSAQFMVGAGSSSAGTAPIKLTSGTLMSSPESGAIEFDGTSFYLTASGIRKSITLGIQPLALGGTGADLSATGGAHEYLKQSSTGAVITVGGILGADIPIDNSTITLNGSGQLQSTGGGSGGTSMVPYLAYSTAVSPPPGTAVVKCLYAGAVTVNLPAITSTTPAMLIMHQAGTGTALVPNSFAGDSIDTTSVSHDIILIPNYGSGSSAWNKMQP